MRALKIGVGLLALLLAGAMPGQVRRIGPSVVRPQAAGDTVTLSTTTNTESFTLVPGGPAAGSAAISAMVSWNVSQSRSLSVYLYFASSTAALSGGGSPAVNIPSSEVLANSSFGVTSFTPFTQACPFAGGSSCVAILSNYTINGSAGGSGTIHLEIDLTNQPQLPAGTYTGVLYAQAQAI